METPMRGFLFVCALLFSSCGACAGGGGGSVGKIVVPYEGTPEVVIPHMIKMAGINSGDVVMDLGCGDGRIPIRAAKDVGARGICVELDPKLVARAHARVKSAGVESKVVVEQGDLFEADLTRASVITLFLWDDVNLQLRPSLLKLTPGTRILSLGHPMGAWRPDQVIRFGFTGWEDSNLYLWIVPADVAGVWRFEIAETTIDVHIVQKFQTFTGTLADGTKRLVVHGGIVKGDGVTFTLRHGAHVQTYTGHFTDNRLHGEGWRALR